VVLAVYVIIAFTWFVLGGDPFTLFLESGTIGTLILLVVYVLATIGMVRLVFFSGDTRIRRWELVIPVLGIVVLGYTLFRNVWPLPTGVAWWGPSVAIAWLLVGIAWVLVRPAATHRAGELLTQAEGLSQPTDSEPDRLSRQGS
jgi:sorbitol-specific phosphotransferase system component IIC